MATSKEVTVWCDACNQWTYGDSPPAKTVKEARAAARRLGWVHRAARDLCPKCAKWEDPE